MKRLVRVLTALLCAISIAYPAQATLAYAPTAPAYEFWHVDHLNDAFFDGQTTYLDVSPRGEFSKWWDPVALRYFSPSPAQIKSAHRSVLAANTVVQFPDGDLVELQIKSSGAKCGYSVGVNLDYAPKGQPDQTFYVITKLNPPRTTGYCGELVSQHYDALLVSAYQLSDGRLMVVDYLHGMVVLLKEPPHQLTALGASMLLVPGDLLGPALDAAGESQRARYAALLKVMRDHPPVSVLQRNADGH